jgi:hypothetical protein
MTLCIYLWDVLYAIATDPGTIAMVQGFGFSMKIWGFTLVKFSYSLRQVAESRAWAWHSHHEHSSTAPKSWPPNSLSEPIWMRIDTENGTWSWPPCCWHRTCPSILEQGISADEHKLCSPWHPTGSNPCHGGKQPSAFATSGNSYDQSVEDLNPILVHHLWILDWLEPRRSVTGTDTNWRTD